jgi:diguanylate cyclase (GGDEF)-like protein
MQKKEFSIIALDEEGAKKIVMSKNIYSEHFNSYAILTLVIETNKFFDPLIISMMNGIDKAVLYNFEGEIFALWPQITLSQNLDSSVTTISHLPQFSTISQRELQESSMKGGVQILSSKDAYIPLSLISDFPFTVALYVDIPTVMKAYDSASKINFVAIFVLLIILLFINHRLNHQRNAKETLQQHMVDELSQKVQQRTADLERLSSQDTLTGLMNRRQFNVLVEEEMKKTFSSYAPFSLIAIDLDGFKHINDTYGHVIGDEVLIHTSQLLVKYLGDRGYISRWGGDELMILLPNTEGTLAFNMGSELCRIIEQNRYKDEILCTMSIGVAQYKTSEEFVSLVRRADTALYQAKNEGKNRAILAK